MDRTTLRHHHDELSRRGGLARLRRTALRGAEKTRRAAGEGLLGRPETLWPDLWTILLDGSGDGQRADRLWLRDGAAVCCEDGRMGHGCLLADADGGRLVVVRDPDGLLIVGGLAAGTPPTVLAAAENSDLRLDLTWSGPRLTGVVHTELHRGRETTYLETEILWPEDAALPTAIRSRGVGDDVEEWQRGWRTEWRGRPVLPPLPELERRVREDLVAALVTALSDPQLAGVTAATIVYDDDQWALVCGDLELEPDPRHPAPDGPEDDDVFGVYSGRQAYLDPHLERIDADGETLLRLFEDELQATGRHERASAAARAVAAEATDRLRALRGPDAPIVRAERANA